VTRTRSRARRSPCSAAPSWRADPKHWDDAIAQAQQGAFLNPRDPLVQMAVGQIFEAGKQHRPGRARLRPRPGRRSRLYAGARRQRRRAHSQGPDGRGSRRRPEDRAGNAEQRAGPAPARPPLLRKGDWQNAATALEAAARLAPGDAETQARLGTAEQYVGKKAESLAAYKKAVELDPKNVDYRTTYGSSCGVNGQANAGVEELKKVVATPGYADSAGYVNLGWLYRNTEPKRRTIRSRPTRRAWSSTPRKSRPRWEWAGRTST
jgi:tetratricopeptide (TPR) repeat protein